MRYIIHLGSRRLVCHIARGVSLPSGSGREADVQVRRKVRMRATTILSCPKVHLQEKAMRSRTIPTIYHFHQVRLLQSILHYHHIPRPAQDTEDNRSMCDHQIRSQSQSHSGISIDHHQLDHLHNHSDLLLVSYHPDRQYPRHQVQV
jgi:hypothetical protein